MTRAGIVDATGTEREVDVIVMVTGFGAANCIAILDVSRRGGASLHKTWARNPQRFSPSD